ncbi:WYL domain-containing protein [Bifidobacterium aquikefiri]
MEYTDGAGRTHRKIVAPAKIFVDEGVYYVAAWTDLYHVIDMSAMSDEFKEIITKQSEQLTHMKGEHRQWQVLRLARIEHAQLVETENVPEIPDVPISTLREWSFDNGTAAVIITDKKHLAFVKSLPGATVDDNGTGERVHLTVSSDSWFVAFCISHARHITAVAPETLRTMIVARAERELSLGENSIANEE